MHEDLERANNIVNSSAELDESVNATTAQSEEAKQIANITTQKAVEGNEAIESAVNAIEDLADQIDESAKKVDDLAETASKVSIVISVIQSVAEQTSLLALNAAIEPVLIYSEIEVSIGYYRMTGLPSGQNGVRRWWHWMRQAVWLG